MKMPAELGVDLADLLDRVADAPGDRGASLLRRVPDLALAAEQAKRALEALGELLELGLRPLCPREIAVALGLLQLSSQLAHARLALRAGARVHRGAGVGLEHAACNLHAVDALARRC